VCALVKELKAAVLNCNCSLQSNEAFANVSQKSLILDLMRATNELLEKSEWLDHFVLCRLHQDCKEKVRVETADNTSRIDQVLRNVVFDANHNVFLTHRRPKCQQFLALAPLESKQESVGAKDVSAVSRKSDERKAATAALRCCRAWKQRLSNKDARGVSVCGSKCCPALWEGQNGGWAAFWPRKLHWNWHQTPQRSNVQVPAH